MKALSNIIQRIDAKYLFLAGGTSVVSGFAAIIFSESSIAVWLFLTCIASAIAFAGLIAIKIVFGIFSATASIARGSRARPSHKSKRNVPLIIVGLITLIAVSSLRSSIGGGIAVSIIQVCALVIVLYGFGMSWTRKGRQNESNDLSVPTVLEKAQNEYTIGLVKLTEKQAKFIIKQYGLEASKIDTLILLLYGYCFLQLTHRLIANGTTPEKSRHVMIKMIRDIARLITADNPAEEQNAYEHLNKAISISVKEHVNIPVGKLSVVYGKFIAGVVDPDGKHPEMMLVGLLLPPLTDGMKDFTDNLVNTTAKHI